MAASEIVRTELDARATLHVLSLSCTFPNPLQDNLGLFVRSRLEHLAAIAKMVVIAPVAVIEYGNPTRRNWHSQSLPTSQNGALEVHYPRWFYPPGGGVFNALLLFMQTFGTVRKLRRRFRIDVLDAHFAYPDGIAAALLSLVFRCPFTITLRGNETLHAKYVLRGPVIRWAIQRAAGVIAVSGALRDFAISCGAEPAHVQVIPNGVNTTLFCRKTTSTVVERLGLSNQAPLILSVGYLIERKGHHHLIRAMNALRARGVSAQLAIVGGPGGEGQYQQVLQQLVNEAHLEDAVRFTGPLPPTVLAELMSQADLVCLASSREGWPNVVNEALACGTPVVATNIGGVPDMLPSEDYGFIVPVGEQDLLERAVQRALEKQWDRERIASWGASRSWDQVAVEVLNALSSAAHRV